MKPLADRLDIPWPLSGRPFWRGLPIPYTTALFDGEPDFKVNDPFRTMRVIRQRKCALCGEPLAATMFFIGGPKCTEFHCFLDPAMHRDCAIYALRVCPFLGMIKGYAKTYRQGLTVVELVEAEPPKEFFLFRTRDFSLVDLPHGNIAIKALNPEYMPVPQPVTDEWASSVFQ